MMADAAENLVPDFYSVPQIAKKMAMSVDELEPFIKSFKLRVIVKPGGRKRRVAREDYEEFRKWYRTEFLIEKPEAKPCRSKPKAVRTGNTTSKSKVIDFTEVSQMMAAGKFPKPSRSKKQSTTKP